MTSQGSTMALQVTHKHILGVIWNDESPISNHFFRSLSFCCCSSGHGKMRKHASLAHVNFPCFAKFGVKF